MAYCGEYAQMANGEKWLPDGIQCALKIIPCLIIFTASSFELPVKPSPNLPNGFAIDLYPSLCFLREQILA